MRTKFFLPILWVIYATSIYGCKTLETKNQADQFDSALIQYGAALRWGRYPQAASFHMIEDKMMPSINLENLENFSVVGFHVLSKNIIPSASPELVNKRNIVAELSYFHKEQGTIRKIKLNQLWWYHKESKHWRTDSDFPEFK